MDAEQYLEDRKEKAFALSLPILVTGIGAAGRSFEEETEVLSISSEEARFKLKTRIQVGSKVFLALDIPRTLILEKPLRLLLSGSVVSIRSDASGRKRQSVAARLNRSFKLMPFPQNGS